MKLAFASILLVSCNDYPKSEPMEIDAGVSEEGKMWVTGERQIRYTCPSKDCGVVGKFYFREGVTVIEEKAGWARITKPYDGACKQNKSRYVDVGNSTCSSDNGFVDGKFSEWVELSGLSATRPADPAETATASESLVSQSDDFEKYRKQFVKLSDKLISEGRCSPADFIEMGGWVKAEIEYKNEPVYFTYCGGITAAHKIYINAETSTILP